MFICPTCFKKFKTEELIQKHYLKCWKEHNPNPPPSKSVASSDIVTRQVNNDIMDFFERINNGRDSH